MRSFLINKILVNSDSFHNYESSEVSLAGGPNYSSLQLGNEQTSEVSIFNKIGSGKKITIDHIDVIPISRMQNQDSANAGGYSVNTITAQLGGIDIGYIKLNSTNENPSDLISVKYKTNDTINKLLRRINIAVKNTITTNTINVNNFAGNVFNTVNVLNGSNKLSSIQRITLYEGEGINLVGTQAYRNEAVRIDVTLRDTLSSGGFGTIIYTIDTVVDKTSSMISIFNKVGSGSTVYVESINVYPICKISLMSSAGNTTLPSYFVFPIQGHKKGYNIDAISLNSSNAAISSSIEIKQKASIQYGYDQGRFIKPALMFIGCGLLNDIYFFIGTNTVSRLNRSEYVLKNEIYEGEGLAVICANPASEGLYELAIYFTEIDYTAPSSGGETGFAYA
jgi:hypothetical protein